MARSNRLSSKLPLFDRINVSRVDFHQSSLSDKSAFCQLKASLPIGQKVLLREDK